MSPKGGGAGESAVDLFGVRFSNPVLLAAGTAGFGEPVLSSISPAEIGGLVTKSVTLEPRWGNPAPRVTEFRGGMLNSVGLANPGMRAVQRKKLPWMARNLADTQVFVSVAGQSSAEYAAVVKGLEPGDGFLGFELNLSCPNDSHRSGTPFCFDLDALRQVLDDVRPLTERPLLVKLAPGDPAIGSAAAAAAERGADGVTAVNTIPGFLPAERGRRGLGAGTGGVSGTGILPLGLAAVRAIAEAADVPIAGVGGIVSAADARAYLDAGASLVQIGTGSLADPRCAARVARQLAGPKFARRRGPQA